MAEEFDIEVIEHDDRNAHFVVRGVTPAFANGIRRAMIADVPTMSIDSVRVLENSSVMFDEMIGTRLGLVPLSAPPGEFTEDNEITLRLDVEGPATAYSGDLESSDEMLAPADEHIPIIDLKEGQRLALEADARLGRGRDHSKHQAGVAVGYRHLQTVEVLGDAEEYSDDEPQIVRGVIEEDGELIPTDTFDNDLRNRYPDKEVAVHDVPNAFVFHVETDGSMPVEDLVTAAVESLHERADELEQAVAL